MRRWLRVFVLLIMSAGLVACGGVEGPESKRTPITVQLNWIHQSNNAGLYVADQKGYYAAEGLAVSSVPGGATIDHITPIVNGAAQFGVVSGDEVLLARAQGKPLRAIATIFRRSPAVYIALANSGITRPHDFVGKTIRLTPSTALSFRAMMARVGVRPDQYTVVSADNDLAEFVSSRIPIWGVYVNAFAVTVQRAGHKINLIYPDDYGVHFYSDSLVASEDLIATKPDLVHRFLRATLRGWTYAVENPTAIGPMVVKYRPDADPELETAKMLASVPLVNTGEDHLGWMKQEVWAGMAKTLREQGVLTKPLDVTQLYTLGFLQEIYSP